MSSNTTYLITGANRGLGKGLVAGYLALARTTVIAAVRDPQHESARSLLQLPKGDESNLIVVRMEVGSAKSIQEAFKEIKESHGIKVIDTLISNAGLGEITGKLVDTPLSVMQRYIDVNAYGPLELFKEALPLLSQSASPKFLTITSVGGSFGLMDTTTPTAAYGASKALANYFVKRLALENRNVVIWAMHPGFVATDMGNSAIKGFADMGIDLGGLKPTSIDDTVKAITTVVDQATIDKTQGKFLGPDGNELPW